MLHGTRNSHMAKLRTLLPSFTVPLREGGRDVPFSGVGEGWGYLHHLIRMFT